MTSGWRGALDSHVSRFQAATLSPRTRKQLWAFGGAVIGFLTFVSFVCSVYAGHKLTHLSVSQALWGGVGTEFFDGSVMGSGGVGVCSRVIAPEGSNCFVEYVSGGLALPVAGSGFGFDCAEVDRVLWSNASNAVDASGQMTGGGDPLLGPYWTGSELVRAALFAECASGKTEALFNVAFGNLLVVTLGVVSLMNSRAPRPALQVCCGAAHESGRAQRARAPPPPQWLGIVLLALAFFHEIRAADLMNKAAVTAVKLVPYADCSGIPDQYYSNEIYSVVRRACGIRARAGWCLRVCVCVCVGGGRGHDMEPRVPLCAGDEELFAEPPVAEHGWRDALVRVSAGAGDAGGLREPRRAHVCCAWLVVPDRPGGGQSRPVGRKHLGVHSHGAGGRGAGDDFHRACTECSGVAARICNSFATLFVRSFGALPFSQRVCSMRGRRGATRAGSRRRTMMP